MLRINHAVLHGFELEIGQCDLSQREMDLSVKQTKSYVTKSVRHILNNASSNHGSFLEGSAFREELGSYFAATQSFLDISCYVADVLYDALRKSEDLDSCDLLVVDFIDTAPKRSSVGLQEAGAADAAANAAVDGVANVPAGANAAVDPASSAALTEGDANYDDLGVRGLALLLLPRKRAFVHDVRTEAGQAYNDIVRHDSTLPNPSQKIDTYVVIMADDMSIDFHDVPRTVMGKKTNIVPELLLSCTRVASHKEVVDSVTRLAEEVAQDFGMPSAVAAAKAKSYVIDVASGADSLAPERLGDAVFAEENPEAAAKYRQELAQQHLPHKVSVGKSAAKRLAKSHRIRTDTGIEISFPSSYAASSDFISFERGENGKIVIAIKNVNSIENR